MTTLGTANNARTPSGMKVAPQSYKKLEAAATQLREVLPFVGQRSDTNQRIDGWRLLEQTLPKAGYQYHVAEVSELEDCAAFTVPDRKLVVLRNDIFEGLHTDNPFSRSTVVHELAHIVLEHHVTLHRGAVLGRHEFYEDSEWQAKAMTAAVMMPIRVCEVVGSAEELARVCGTSVQAARYRLERLQSKGIIKPKGLFW